MSHKLELSKETIRVISGLESGHAHGGTVSWIVELTTNLISNTTPQAPAPTKTRICSETVMA